jgi:hypothetical protein
MYSLIALVHLDGEAAPISAAFSKLGATVAPVMEGNFNGGDLSAIWNFDDEAAFRTARSAINAILNGAGVARADTAFFRHGATGVREPGLSTGVHRTLFLCADHHVSDARRAQFEAEMALMPKYIPAIRNWRLSRVVEAAGELPWTHVWEQEFVDVGGLTGPYMLHPWHWAFIDRWFDPECPDWIVNPRLCHSFAAYGVAILSS